MLSHAQGLFFSTLPTFLVESQRVNGSWENDLYLTGVAIESLLHQDSPIQITTPENGDYVNGDFSVTGVTGDEISSVYVNGVPAIISGNTYSATVNMSNEGRNSIVAKGVKHNGAIITTSSLVTQRTFISINVESPLPLSNVETETIQVVGTTNTPDSTVTVNGISALVVGYDFSAEIQLVIDENDKSSIEISAIDPRGATGHIEFIINYTPLPTTYYVDAILGDDSATCKAQGVNACKTLDATIAKARNGDSILLSAGTFLEEQISISKNLTIVGNATQGAVIIKPAFDLTDTTFIRVSDAIVNFENISFNCEGKPVKTVLAYNEGNGHIKNCNFENISNGSSEYGSLAIFVRGDVDVQDSHFSNIQLTAIYIYFATSDISPSCNITNSVFIGNGANLTYPEYGIEIQANNSTTVTYCSFYNYNGSHDPTYASYPIHFFDVNGNTLTDNCYNSSGYFILSSYSSEPLENVSENNVRNGCE